MQLNSCCQEYLHFVEIQVHVLVCFQDVRLLAEDVVKEFGKNERCPLIFLSRLSDFLLHANVLAMQLLILPLTFLKLLFDFVEFVLQEVYQFLVILL